MRERLCATGRYQARDFAGLRSVIELDDRFTAPSFGFGDAANYYRTQSAIGYLAGLRVPALLIQAKDDTFVPFAIYESAAVRANPWIAAGGDGAWRPSGIPRARAAPFVVGYGDNGVDQRGRC